ncbi:hypothetical protein C8R45DRAFT_1098750 [Mycena sanguinolenta]|nr:hypothetical protein C8R45DRAFT_1098750 [Mycena sanguinolenta]
MISRKPLSTLRDHAAAANTWVSTQALLSFPTFLLNEPPEASHDGAPMGDPFQVPAPVGGPVFHDPRALGHGPPPRTPVGPARASSLHTPVAANYNRSGLNQMRASSMNMGTTADNLDSFGYNTSSINTPTQSNRHHGPSRLPPAHHQPMILEERMQMEHLIEMMQDLRSDNAEVKARLSAIETILSRAWPSAPQAARGISGQRGRGITRSTRTTRRNQLPPTDIADSDSEAPGPAPSTSVAESDGDASELAATNTTTDPSTESDRDGETSDDDDEEDALLPTTADVLPNERRVLQAGTLLAGYVTKAFRRLCDVSGKQWPDPNIIRTNPETRQVYPTPFFSAEVTDHRNMAFVSDVAYTVLSELKNRDAWPPALKRSRGMPGPTFDLRYLQALAQKSFGTLKRQWKQGTDVDAAAKEEEAQRNNRHTKRRIRKSNQLLKVSTKFAEEHGLDSAFVADLVHEQYLSDEVSESEEGSGETKEAWKVRLAGAAKLPVDATSQKKLKILEILVPSWRSEPYSTIIHDLQRFRLDGLSATQELALTYHRVGMGRPSDRIPIYAPYNFGISTQWWRENHHVPANKSMLKGWMKYPEPAESGLILERGDDGEVISISYAS